MVDLPEAERPVNQIVKPFCLRKVLRSARERDGCHVMLLGRNVSDARWRWRWRGRYGGVNARCHVGWYGGVTVMELRDVVQKGGMK